MNEKKQMKQRLFIGLVLIFVGICGAVFAKAVPMTSGNGFSDLFKKEVKETATSTEETTTVESKKEEPVVELTYAEQVNKNIKDKKYANRMDIPLLLQTDNRWKDTAYGVGSDEGNNLAINGCAILSLAMVTSYLDGKETLPDAILQWSGNDYFMEGQGTAWSIFYEYALMKGYQYEELGVDFEAVAAHVSSGHPVIVSVQPGLFTETGHIMVISGTQNGNFWLNDPNDSAEKGHSNKEFTQAELANEVYNFWAIYK